MQTTDAKKSARAWYVLRTVSGKEAKVKEYIEAAMANGHFGGHVFQVLVPTEKVITRTPTGKRATKDRMVLPGYVLVEARLVGETLHALRNVPNVLGYLGGMECPTPLRDYEIEHILRQGEDSDTAQVDVEIPFHPGESVKVIEGPFTGMSGVIEKIDEERKKVTVMVKVFGRATGLDLSVMQIEKE